MDSDHLQYTYLRPQWFGQSVVHEVTTGHCISPPGNLREISKKKTSETKERRTRQVLEGCHLAEDSAS